LFDISPRPGCIRFEIGTCLGPCTFGSTRGAYDRQVEAARAFLTGADTRAVDWLQEQMADAAGRLQFEQAARLRDDFRSVEWLGRRCMDLATARHEFTFIYKPPAVAVRPVWYLIRRGVLEGAVAAPENSRDRRKVDKLIEHWVAADNRLGHRFAPRPETLALVSSWFRNQRGEFKHTSRVPIAGVTPASNHPPSKKAKLRADRAS
jgi:excinuclease ABC subunit C